MIHENAGRDKPIDLADIDLSPKLDLDVTRPRPQFDFRVHVECSRVLGRPHVDSTIGQRVDLHLPTGQALSIADDQPLRGENCRVAHRLERSVRLFPLNKNAEDVLRNRNLYQNSLRSHRGHLQPTFPPHQKIMAPETRTPSTTEAIKHNLTIQANGNIYQDTNEYYGSKF